MGEAVGDAVDKLALKLAAAGLGWGLQRAPQPESAKPVASTNSPPEDTRPSRQETLRTILQATQTIVLLLRFMGSVARSAWSSRPQPADTSCVGHQAPDTRRWNEAAKGTEWPTKQPAARPSHGTGQVIKVRGYTRSGVPVKAHERGGPKSADPQAPKDPRLLPFTLPFEVPEPTTVQGWQKLWDQVPDSEWGGADVSYSVQMPDGRRVWLYGDTFSGRNGFVHSTAITQSGGRLHVSNKGKQLLPDEKPKGTRQTIYWITDAKAVGRNKLKIFATPTSVGKAGPWDFRQVGNKSRVAMATVDRRGNVNFDRWDGYVPIHRTSYDRGQDMKVDPKNPRHFTYARTVHPIKLANGKKLVTVCQNWDDPMENHRNADGSFRYRDFRPYFTQE